jgi:hypothetical protein
MTAKASASASGPGLDKIKKDMAALMNMDVLVGIPENKSARKGTDTVNNAELLYIHTHGSALRHIPARPVIEPAIEHGQAKLSEGMGTAAQLLLEGKPAQAKKQLKAVGLMGQTMAQEWFYDQRNGWPPDSPETIARKIDKMRGKKKKEALANPGEATTTLIDTAQMQKAIVWVLRENGQQAGEGDD